MTEILTWEFQEARTKMKGSEAILFLGCGGSLQEWVDGLTGRLEKEGIIPSGYEWPRIAKLSTTGGRTDLLFEFGPGIEVGRLAMWRLMVHGQFPNSWWSDYVVNYADHHGYEVDPEDDWEEEDDEGS